MKEINLDEILLEIVPEDCYWEDMGNLTNCPKEYVLKAMKEAIKRTLELAAENAKTLVISEYEVIVNKKTILNTIKQIK